MVRITEDLVRKRAEHNNCELSTLEEVSLHQLDIERIELLDKVCRELQILYLQSNLIPKIENVGRLKKLEYLNLALNNVTKIENLTGCESLQKLDLTVNFVGELTSVENLKDNYYLRELFLTGNPCTQYNGYREYVIITLPQLQMLDGREIEKSERILAKQVYENIKINIIDQEKEYAEEIAKKKDEIKTEKQREPGYDGKWYTDMDAHLAENSQSEKERNYSQSEKERKQKEEDEARFWQEKVEYTPESRLEVHKHMEEKRKEREGPDQRTEKVQKEVRFFAKDGRPLNINQGKLDFMFTDDEENNAFVLDLSCPKYLDTSLIDIDLQPMYVRVTVKGKIMQLALQEEINSDSSTAKRSQVTGHLLITMPKIKEIFKPKKKTTENNQPTKNATSQINSSGLTKLEVDPSVLKEVDFGNIVRGKPKKTQEQIKEGEPVNKTKDEEFADDHDVPPLI